MSDCCGNMHSMPCYNCPLRESVNPQVKTLTREVSKLKQQVRERDAIIKALRKQLSEANDAWRPNSIHEVF